MRRGDVTHDCQKIEDSLLDLVFPDGGAGASGDERRRTLAEVERCAHCHEQYLAFQVTLERFDEAADLMQPDESYWSGYDERLRAALFADARPGLWQRSADAMRGRTPRPAWALTFATLVVIALLAWAWLRQPSALVSYQPAQQAQVDSKPGPAPEQRQEQSPNPQIGQEKNDERQEPEGVKRNRPSPSSQRKFGEQVAARVDRPLEKPRREAVERVPERVEASVPVLAANVMPSATIAAIVDDETLQHFERSQNLLRSFRNLRLEGKESRAAIADERQRSRSLLFQNIVLRRDAEIKGNLPVEQVLNDLEPVLIDIANLPDGAAPGEVRAIRSRMQRKAIITALQAYSARPMIAGTSTD